MTDKGENQKDSGKGNRQHPFKSRDRCLKRVSENRVEDITDAQPFRHDIRKRDVDEREHKQKQQRCTSNDPKNPVFIGKIPC